MDIVRARRERTRKPLHVPRQTNDFFPFAGGLNLIDSPLSATPGQCQGALNYEMGFAGGYRRVGGYLGFDGRAEPTGEYELLAYGVATDPALSLGSTVNGAGGASGALFAITEDGGFGVNTILRNQELENALWTPTRVTVADDSLVWTNGVTPTLSKIEKASAGTNLLQYDPSLSAGIGDKIYLSGYVKLGQAFNTLQVSLNNFGGDFVGSGASNVIPVYDINAQTVSDPFNSSIDEAGIELVSDGVYRWWVLSEEVDVADAAFGITLFCTVGPTGNGNTGDYIYYSGVMAVIGTNPKPTNGFGYINTVAAAKNVNTGNLIFDAVAGGPFVDDEDLDVLSTVFGQGIGTNLLNGETDPQLDAEYTALVSITETAAPVGSGPVRGVWMHEGTVYAFRDNTGATACDMWEATVAGWVQITLNDVVHFDAGDGTEPAEGATLDGVSSSASALIKRIVKTSGTWGIDAVGYFVLGTVSGGPYTNNEVLNVSAARVADADGNSAVPVLVAGGRYEFRSHNFYGHAAKYRMYGVDGKNFAFEYDKDEGVFTQIETGMTTDTPIHLAVHNMHLFLGFIGGSVQLSGDGVPLIFTVITGASEIGVGDEITGFNEEVGNSLFIFTRDRSYVLQGNTRANFDLDDFNVNAGAHEWSVQRIGLGTFFDDRGFTTLLQTQRTGSVNFQENTQSELIQPLVVNLIKNSAVKCSHLLRNQNIYRCYFDDGRVVSIGFSGHKVSGHMPLEYPFIANVACSEEGATGAERVFVGAEDGFVYELETGASFNGEAISYFLRTVLYNSDSPGRFKKYQQARLDATLSGALTLTGQIEYDFHDDAFNLADELDFSTDEAGGYWDDFVWDKFVWDKPTSGIPQQKLEGEGVNAAVYLVGNSASDDAHTLRGVTLQWLPRRDDRRN